MLEQENRPSNFWERTLTAIAITFSVVGYYKMLSSAQASPYEIYNREIFKKNSEKIFELQKVKILKISTKIEYYSKVKL